MHHFQKPAAQQRTCSLPAFTLKDEVMHGCDHSARCYLLAVKHLCVIAFLILLAACGDDDSTILDQGVDVRSDTLLHQADATVDTQTNPPIACSDEDCNDGTFCNGVETCRNGLCTRGAPPCPANECDEQADACESCDDADGDGAKDAACGGTDCDDSNPNRAPGLMEVCDANDTDEDCDPRTFGFRDIDGDDEIAMECCNQANDGTRYCGLDCDDSKLSVNTLGVETCDMIDQDCDGTVDEGVKQTFYRDGDEDGFGALQGETMLMCSAVPGWSPENTDCDDRNRAINPDAAEICGNGIEDDCNLATGDDDDKIDCYADADADGFFSNSVSRICADSTGGCPRGYQHQPPLAREADCCDADARTFPRAQEYYTRADRCGSFDYNCTGSIGSRIDATCETTPQSICNTSSRWYMTIPECGQDGVVVDCEWVTPSAIAPNIPWGCLPKDNPVQATRACR